MSTLIPPLTRGGKHDPNVRDGLRGVTPLMMAAQRGLEATVDALLQKKSVDLHLRDRENGMSALALTCRNGHLPVVVLLVGRGGDLNALVRGCRGRVGHDMEGRGGLGWQSRKALPRPAEVLPGEHSTAALETTTQTEAIQPYTRQDIAA